MSGAAAIPFTFPNRRVSRCEKVVYREPMDLSRPAGEDNCRAERRFYLRCGFDTDGAVRELFYAAKHETADVVELATDICILISQQLQTGSRLTELAVHAPAGFLGTIIATAIKIEAAEGEAVRAQYREVA